MAKRRVHFILGALTSFSLAAASVHCSSEEPQTSGSFATSGVTTGGGGATSVANAGSTGIGGDLGFDASTQDHSAERIFGDDPPPMGCDGGGQPPSPGGTPECPGDKNLEGCPCGTEGEVAACWPGLRKNRNRGVCHDGTTTCTLQGENSLQWGPCTGYQLPTGDEGKAACLCFSGGHWDIDNLAPCFFTTDGETVAVSTTLVNGQPQCPASAEAPPAEPWSTNRLTVDCTGYFSLCYTLKAGDGASPEPTDCVIESVCTAQHYAPANAVVEFPPLPSWLSSPADAACVQQFVDSGGYGEMSVVGESDECDLVNKVFQRVTYCPLSCNGPNPGPECASCQPGGGGDF